jgi:hypothetical protein
MVPQLLAAAAARSCVLTAQSFGRRKSQIPALAATFPEKLPSEVCLVVQLQHSQAPKALALFQ